MTLSNTLLLSSFTVFKKEMEKAVASDLSGDLKRLMVACITVSS